jgi:hypothetical protein
VATATCEHGLAPGTCLICATLKGGPVVPAGSARPPAPTPPDRPRIGVLGGLVVVAAVAVVAWFLIHLVWGVLRLVELALVGAVCGYVGFRIGVAVGRRQGRRGR